jgi:hypothetical protein
MAFMNKKRLKYLTEKDLYQCVMCKELRTECAMAVILPKRRGQCRRCNINIYERIQWNLKYGRVIKRQALIAYHKKTYPIKNCIFQLKKMGIENPSPELIKTYQEFVLFKRKFQEFKSWRKDNESNYSDVYGKQLPNEENHEGWIQA